MFKKPKDHTLITADGRKFKVTIKRDDDAGLPWKNCDGHGHIIEAKRELNYLPSFVKYLGCKNRQHYYYDMAESRKIAERDGWNAEPYDTPNKGERAALADFENLKAYLAGEWGYCWVLVEELCPCCGTPQDGKRASLAGIESTAGDYFADVVQELIHEIE